LQIRFITVPPAASVGYRFRFIVGGWASLRGEFEFQGGASFTLGVKGAWVFFVLKANNNLSSILAEQVASCPCERDQPPDSAHVILRHPNRRSAPFFCITRRVSFRRFDCQWLRGQPRVPGDNTHSDGGSRKRENFPIRESRNARVSGWESEIASTFPTPVASY
jgi:hypothetical protein